MLRTPRPLTAACAAVAAVASMVPAGTAMAAPRPATTTTPHYATGASVSPVRVPARLRTSANEVLPTSVDLRTGAPPVGDQGYVGSCVAWSIGYSLSGYYAQKLTTSGAPYAALYLYMRSVSGTPGPNTGLYPPVALGNAQNEGIDNQADYWQGTTNVVDYPTAAEITNAANYRVSSWTTLFSGVQTGTVAQTAIQQSLAAGNPVSISIPVYNDFFRISSMTPYTATSGTLAGYHQITAYGYDSTGLIIRNSWGVGWGSSGDAKLAWSFVNSKVMAAYTIAGVTDKGRTAVTAPAITRLSAARAVAGATITITGTSLAAATAVKFGTTGTTFTNVTGADGRIGLAALVPAGKTGTTVDVTVTNGGGSSATSTTTKFTYLAPPPTLVAPTATASTLGGTAITLTGTGLTGASTVKINGVGSAPARNVSDTSLTFTAPARSTAGGVDLAVVTSGGTATSRMVYALPPAPATGTFSPTSVATNATTVVTVTGTSFVGTVTATVDGSRASVTRTSDTQVKVTVPKHPAGTVPVVITAAGGTAGVSLTYSSPAPVVRSYAPAVAKAATETTITVTGSNFTGTTAVLVGDKPVSFQVTSDTVLKVTIPATAPGSYGLRVVSPAGSTTGPSPFVVSA